MAGLGNGALIAAAIVTILGAVFAALPLLSARHHGTAPRTVHHRLSAAAFAVAIGLVVVATGVLINAVMTQDLGLTYVARQSRAESSAAYRLAALWGGAEGSLLFFTCLLGLVAGAVVLRRDAPRFAPLLAHLTVGLLIITVAAFANPFATLAVPALAGAGLTPILEHPAMLYHPPILYLGLVATVVPFLLASDGHSTPFHSGMRRWALGAWTLLTVGLATGANWAYVEVGWGGYWAWDPVENTVLIPWLALTGLLHFSRSPTLLTVAPRAFTLLAMAPFVLVAVGSAVTRSGGLSSVHAFADSTAIGWMLSVLIAITLTATLAAARLTQVEPTDARHTTRSGRSLLVVTVSITVLFAIVVLLGVMYPLVAPGEQVVAASYYNRVGAPLALFALAATGFSMLRWSPGITRPQVTRSAVIAGGCSAAAIGFAVLLGARGAFGLLTAAAVGASLAGLLPPPSNSRTGPRTAMLLGHLGMAVVLIGIAGSAMADETRVVLRPSEEVTVGGYVFGFESFAVNDGPRANSEQVTAQVSMRHQDDDRESPHIFEPAVVSYPDRRVVLPETALHSTPKRDVQMVLRSIDRNGLAQFDFAVRPLVMLIWWGAAILTIAGVWALARTWRT